MISKRHAKANEEKLKDYGYYEPDKPNKHLLYLDANNLYGWAMCEKMPISEFKWEKEEQCTEFLNNENFLNI